MERVHSVGCNAVVGLKGNHWSVKSSASSPIGQEHPWDRECLLNQSYLSLSAWCSSSLRQYISRSSKEWPTPVWTMIYGLEDKREALDCEVSRVSSQLPHASAHLNSGRPILWSATLRENDFGSSTQNLRRRDLTAKLQSIYWKFIKRERCFSHR